jgi:hypothetical protein
MTEKANAQVDSAPIEFREWEQEAIRRFGQHPSGWRFKCPCCGHVQSMQDFKDLGVDVNLAYFNCVGRHDGKHMDVDMGTKPGPCNYTGGGLFNLNPVAVKHPETGGTVHVFAFADGDQ